MSVADLELPDRQQPVPADEASGAVRGPVEPSRTLPPGTQLPERLGFRLKRRLLGAPLVTSSLASERLSNFAALGVLSPDCISSSAYGTEEMLVELLPFFGLAAFTIVLPITGVVLLILVLMTLSYREVVQVYTRAGGSYVVARENFGPRVAQVAAVALLIDYVVTVAVQSAAGTVAVVSAVPRLGPYSLEITVGVVLVIAYGNLRGLREAGRAFALPTYLFALSMGSVIVVGLVRAAVVGLPRYDPHTLAGAVPVGEHSGLFAAAAVLTILRSFANGGSSLTGLEAISNGVSTFRQPEGENARRVLVVMASILGFLVAGASTLAYLTHATPYVSGYPSVISQETRAVFGAGPAGHGFFLFVQAATALILYTGANTSFNGFPHLASFVAGDSFLPRSLTKRGHRLVYSNGIVILAVLAIALLAVTRANVNSLVPFYAIGVFTGFTMAGFGMARYHHIHGESHWRRKLAINASGGGMSLLVVLIFAVVKFTEGAWLVVVLFPILVVALIRINRRYAREADALKLVIPERARAQVTYARHEIVVLVNELDLATLAALRYGKTLRGTMCAAHFVVDADHAETLRRQWRDEADLDTPLELVDCPDRRLDRAVTELALGAVRRPNTFLSVLLPRRSYGLLGRFLHDATAEKMAETVSRIPQAAATIVPFDIESKIDHLLAPSAPSVPERPAAFMATSPRRPARGDTANAYGAPRPGTGVRGIGSLFRGEQVTVEGRIRLVELRPLGGAPVLTCEMYDATGGVTVKFLGRRDIEGITPGRRLRVTGRVTVRSNELVVYNPRYELLPD